MNDPNDNLAPGYMDRRTLMANNTAAEELLSRVQAGDRAPPIPTPVAPATSPVQGDLPVASGNRIQRTAADIGKGVIEAPRAVLTGVRDAFQNTIDLAKDMGDWTNEYLPAIQITGKGAPRIVTAAERKADPSLPGSLADNVEIPTVDAPKTITGGLIKGVAQFLTGFKGAGKLLDAAGVPEVTGKAAYLVNSLKGAMANFTAFDPHQQRLSNLIEKFPVLHNPVTEYLASNPDDSNAEGRFKNALEGLGLGALTDGLFRGVKLLRQSMSTTTVAKTATETLAPEGNSEDLSKILQPEAPAPKPGEPAPAAAPAPPLVVRPGVKAAEKLAAAATRTAPLAADDVVGRMAAPLERIESSAAGRGMEPPKTFINFAHVNTPEDVQKAMQGLADSVPLTPDTAKAGVRSFAEMKLDAAHTNAWDALVSRQTGQPLGDAQMLAARQLWSSATDKLSQLAQEAATSPSEANLFAFRKMLVTHNMIQNEVMGARAAAARAVASWRIPVGSSAERLRELQFSLEQNGGSDVARELAHAVDGMAKAGMISELTTAAEKGAMARTVDAAKEAWTLGLLTSPKTHLRNIVSNGAFVPMQIAERKVASSIASMLGDESSVAAGEASAQYYGLVSGAKDMFRYYGKLLKTRILEGREQADAVMAQNPIMETGLRGAEKMDLPPRAISADALNISESGWLGKGVDAIGSAYGITSNALTAEDNFFKVLGYRMETYAQAFRQARQDAATGAINEEQFADHITNLIQNPPENIRMAATDQALYQTFNEAPGWFGQMLLKAKRNSLMAHVLIPFARTTANLQHAAFERSPLAPLVGQWRADLMAGGARRDLALARWSLGSMATLAIIDATTSGQVTGRGPVDPGQRQAWAREGWRPYSWKIGDRWYSYNGISPIGDQIGMAADLAEVAMHGNQELVEGKDMENITLASIAAIAGNVMNKSYLSGFANAVDALHDPQGGAAQWARQMAGSVVPSVVNATARAMDPNVRQVNSMMDAIRNRIPGMSESLPLAPDLWGEPRKTDSGLGKPFDALSPIFTQKPTPEPIDQELIRLNSNVQMPPTTTSFDGVSVNMKQFPKAYERYVELAGNELKHPAWGLGAKDLLNKIVSGEHPLSQVYQIKSDGPDGGKDIFIQGIINQYRESARRQVLQEFPDLSDQVAAKKAAAQQLRMPVQ